MSKWKLQAVEPNTCDPPGCRYIELWDVEQATPRTHTVVAFDRVCPGHAAAVSPDKMLWEDGNWKPKKAYIKYQREWFRRLNHTEWLVKHPDEPMPPQIARLTSDPVTTGSVSAPPQAEIDGMNRSYNWNRTDNLRVGSAQRLVADELGIEENDIENFTSSFTGVGDDRVLRVTVTDLNSQQRSKMQDVLDIQHGTGKVIVEN